MSETMLTNQQIEDYKTEIDALSHIEIARMIRFSPSGPPFFDNRYPLYDYLMDRFKSLGGWSPAISKEVGLDP